MNFNKELYIKLTLEKGIKEANDWLVDWVEHNYENTLEISVEYMNAAPTYYFIWDLGFGSKRVCFCKEHYIFDIDWDGWNIVIPYKSLEDLADKIEHMIELCKDFERCIEDKIYLITGSKVYDDFINYLKENNDYIENDELSEEQQKELLNWYEDYLSTGEK